MEYVASTENDFQLSIKTIMNVSHTQKHLNMEFHKVPLLGLYFSWFIAMTNILFPRCSRQYFLQMIQSWQSFEYLEQNKYRNGSDAFLGERK